ncbi:MAG: nucleotidyltransferase domain-containing protein [Deltaproteobacteria bacterium]|nr:MAG: nucleotidyltransferase domain-containing protein [Deltaproteobacteria bacterium]
MGDDVVIVRKDAAHTLDELARLAAPSLEQAGALRAVAFGSWARGEADGYSDLDLAVVLPTDLPMLERGSLLRNLVESLPVAVDLLVYTPEEFDRGMQRGYGVFEALVREGVTIYQRRSD